MPQSKRAPQRGPKDRTDTTSNMNIYCVQKLFDWEASIAYEQNRNEDSNANSSKKMRVLLRKQAVYDPYHHSSSFEGWSITIAHKRSQRRHFRQLESTASDPNGQHQTNIVEEVSEGTKSSTDGEGEGEGGADVTTIFMVTSDLETLETMDLPISKRTKGDIIHIRSILSRPVTAACADFILIISLVIRNLTSKPHLQRLIFQDKNLWM